MSNNEHELLSEATCAVIDQEGIKGTAWLFSDSGYLLTAGHVISKMRSKKKQKVQFLSEEPQDVDVIKWVYKPDVYLDFAILRLLTPVRRRPVPISLAYSLTNRAQIASYGYGETLQSLSPGIGTYVGVYTPTAERDYRLFTIESGQLNDVGYSGAPLYATEIKAVVALQISGVDLNIGAHSSSIFGLPLYRVAQEFPDLFHYSHKDPIDENRSFEEKVLLALYEKIDKSYAEPNMSLAALGQRVGLSANAPGELMKFLRRLKEKGLVEYSAVGSGFFGFAWLTSDGQDAVEDMLRVNSHRNNHES